MRLLLIFCYLLFCGGVFAQNSRMSTNKNAQKMYAKAGESIAIKNFAKALEYLKEAIQYDPNFLNAYQQTGDIHRLLKNYSAAKTAYENILAINTEFHSRTYYGIAFSELSMGDYANALQHFKKYLTYQNITPKEKKQIFKYIADCEFSINAIKNPIVFNPQNLGAGINSKYQEYLPVLTADEGLLIFTRMYNNNEDFYISTRKDKKWQAAEYLSNVINTPNFNEGSQCISPDGKYLFYTACNKPEGMGNCDIYYSRREGNTWSRPYNIGGPVNTIDWESQPSLSTDGQTLYFSSTRPGGYGGYDLWKSELLEGGKWSNPVNLGDKINTEYDEQSPFIHPDGETFYFSSNGWPGFGNKDIFMSRLTKNGDWQKPENLGYPINTFGEESSLTISNDGKTAFFASDKEGGFGGLDIYSFEMPKNIRPNPVTFVKGLIVDKKTGKALEANVQLVNLVTGKLSYDGTSDNETGEFLATMPMGNRFALNISKNGYLFNSKNYTLNTTSPDKNYNIHVELEKVEVGGLVVLTNLFFETNKSDLLPESKIELKGLIDFLTVNATTSIEIDGHTDNVGDINSNMELSTNRAKTVYEYLISHNVSASRLTFKGFGESKPIADNNTEEGRKINRRTAFKVTRVF